MQKTGRIIAGLFACALALWAVQASAATEAIGRSFNHMTTGFPLSGGHATAACETCHVGGVPTGKREARGHMVETAADRLSCCARLDRKSVE